MPQPAFASSIITGPIVSSAISDTGAAMDPDKGWAQVLLQGRRKAPGIDQAPALAPEAGRGRPAEARGLQADQSPEGPARVRQAEAAQVLNIPIGTVRSRLARARLRLRLMLSPVLPMERSPGSKE